jgi:hypothetical protein
MHTLYIYIYVYLLIYTHTNTYALCMYHLFGSIDLLFKEKSVLKNSKCLEMKIYESFLIYAIPPPMSSL